MALVSTAYVHYIHCTKDGLFILLHMCFLALNILFLYVRVRESRKLYSVNTTCLGDGTYG